MKLKYVDTDDNTKSWLERLNDQVEPKDELDFPELIQDSPGQTFMFEESEK